MFNQRFALEKLHIIELELARRLIKKGYRVQHLSDVPVTSLTRYNKTMGPLLDIARRIGLEYVYNPNKEIYHQNLAKASILVTTSLADMFPNSVIEGIYPGLVPVAPRNLCFPEFIHPDNLYTPYDLEEMVAIVQKKPLRHHPIEVYSSEKVIERFLAEMNLS